MIEQGVKLVPALWQQTRHLGQLLFLLDRLGFLRYSVQLGVNVILGLSVRKPLDAQSLQQFLIYMLMVSVLSVQAKVSLSVT